MIGLGIGVTCVDIYGNRTSQIAGAIGTDETVVPPWSAPTWRRFRAEFDVRRLHDQASLPTRGRHEIAPYTVYWKNDGRMMGWTNISFEYIRKASFKEKHAFEPVWKKPKTWVTGGLAGMLAGEGAAFFIAGSFEDPGKGQFKVCRWFQ